MSKQHVACCMEPAVGWFPVPLAAVWWMVQAGNRFRAALSSANDPGAENAGSGTAAPMLLSRMISSVVRQ
ncbi:MULTISPECIES: hypothetical protein [Micrococcaceae]|uniref:hypothetical protein n=1 Tax=Micrococcaceae TaxID=1268 RepID=UPI0011B06BEE|nr:hypothetical protein [Arthrobacter sp. N199823]